MTCSINGWYTETDMLHSLLLQQHLMYSNGKAIPSCFWLDFPATMRVGNTSATQVAPMCFPVKKNAYLYKKTTNNFLWITKMMLFLSLKAGRLEIQDKQLYRSQPKELWIAVSTACSVHEHYTEILINWNDPEMVEQKQKYNLGCPYVILLVLCSPQQSPARLWLNVMISPCN